MLRVLVVSYEFFLSDSSKMRSEQGEVTLIQSLGPVGIFPETRIRKIARHTYPGYRCYSL